MGGACWFEVVGGDDRVEMRCGEGEVEAMVRVVV